MDTLALVPAILWRRINDCRMRTVADFQGVARWRFVWCLAWPFLFSDTFHFVAFRSFSDHLSSSRSWNPRVSIALFFALVSANEKALFSFEEIFNVRSKEGKRSRILEESLTILLRFIETGTFHFLRKYSTPRLKRDLSRLQIFF